MKSKIYIHCYKIKVKYRRVRKDFLRMNGFFYEETFFLILHYFAAKITLIFLSVNYPFFFLSLCPKVYQVPSHEEPIHQLDPPLPLSLSSIIKTLQLPMDRRPAAPPDFLIFFVFWLFSFLRDSVAAYIEVEF
jgi:hypothetical protein